MHDELLSVGSAARQRIRRREFVSIARVIPHPWKEGHFHLGVIVIRGV